MGYVPKALFGSTSVEPKIEPSKAPKALFSDSVAAKPITRSDSLFSDSIARHRIKLTVEELAQANPKVSKEVIELAYQTIITTNLEQIRDQDLVLIGSECQKRYGEMVDRFSKSIQGGLIDQCKEAIFNIAHLIESSAPARFTLFKKDKKSIDGTYHLIQHETDFLSNACPSLFKARSSIDGLTLVARELKNNLVSFEIAASFLSQSVDNRYVDLLISRSSSLISSRLGVESLMSQFDLINDTILQLISLIQDTLLVEIPIWRNNQLLSLTDKTAITTVNTQNQKLLNLLKI